MKNAPITMEPILAFSWVAVFLLVGMVLRAKVPFFRKHLIPACILGGVVGFAANSFGLFSWFGFGVQAKSFHAIIYHLFNLTWIFLGLQKPADNRNTGPTAVRRQFWTVGVMLSITSLCLVAVTLGGLVLQSMGNSTPASMGILTVLGFANGPGQALTIAAIWENAVETLAGAKSFALAASSTGYLVSVILGIPILSYLAKRRNIPCVVSPTNAEQAGIYSAGAGPLSGRQTTHPTSLDTMSFHVGLGFVLYMVVLAIYSLLDGILPPGFMKTAWGLFFVISMGVGIAARKILSTMGVDFVCCRDMMTRLNGFLVDFLACATFISIQIGSVLLFLQTFAVSVVLVTIIITSACCIFYKNESFDAVQRFAVMYGTLTGTISTGMVLLRMVDPENKSSAPIELGIAAFLQTPYIMFYMVVSHWEILKGQSAMNIVWAQLITLAIGCIIIWFCRASNTGHQIVTAENA